MENSLLILICVKFLLILLLISTIKSNNFSNILHVSSIIVSVFVIILSYPDSGAMSIIGQAQH